MRDSLISFGTLNIDVVFNAPGDDLAKRFGNLACLGATMGYKLKNNFYLEGGARLVFGSRVKEPVATNVMTLYGNVNQGYSGTATGADGRQSTVRMQARGMQIPIYFGKILPFSKKMNPNSGLYFNVGTQVFQHRIWLEVPANNVPALDKDKRKGYDRLCNGMGVMEGFGIRYHSSKRLFNVHLGIEISQNFTANRRTVNVDTGLHDSGTRLDLLWGIRAAWVVPIYKTSPEKAYYN